MAIMGWAWLFISIGNWYVHGANDTVTLFAITLSNVWFAASALHSNLKKGEMK